MSVYASIDWSQEQQALAAIDVLLTRMVRGSARIDRRAFERRFEQASAFALDQTGFSPLMLYFLYGVAVATGARQLAGGGVYAGIAFSMLAAGAHDAAAGAKISAIGVDDDASCIAQARGNASLLGLGRSLEFRHESPLRFLAHDGEPLDLVMLDVYDPVRNKEDYVPLAKLASRKLRSGGVLLAHDACVPRYQCDLDALIRFLVDSGDFDGPWSLPIDDTGIMLAVRR